MASLYTLAEKNIRKTWLYLALFLSLIVFLGWLLSYYFNEQLIVWAAFFISVFASVGSFWFSDKVVLTMSGAKKIKKEDNPELYRLVENLAITAGLPTPKIYIVNDASPNAFAVGRDPSHAAVAVTSGLLKKLERTELEGVLAHELSHIGNRDTLLATIVVVLLGVAIRTADIFFRSGLSGGQRRSKKSGVLFPLTLLFLLLMPILAQLLRLAISRKREFLADANAGLLTRYPEGLARALEKISQSPLPLKNANNAVAHLFIVSPFKGSRSANWLSKLFSTHPPIRERLKALRGLKT
jgi:heat shock protein HtpX